MASRTRSSASCRPDSGRSSWRNAEVWRPERFNLVTPARGAVVLRVVARLRARRLAGSGARAGVDARGDARGAVSGIQQGRRVHDGAAAGSGRQRRPARPDRSFRRRPVRAAHRVGERRQSAARARVEPDARAGRAHGARRLARAASCASCSPKACCSPRCRRRARHRRQSRRHRGAGRARASGPAAPRRSRPQRAGAPLCGGDDDDHRCAVRPRAGVAGVSRSADRPPSRRPAVAPSADPDGGHGGCSSLEKWRSRSCCSWAAVCCSARSSRCRSPTSDSIRPTSRWDS